MMFVCQVIHSPLTSVMVHNFRYNEPTHVKSLKLEILSLIANQYNCGDISVELSEYIASTDAKIATLAAQSLGTLALRVPEVAPQVVKLMKDFIDEDIGAVLSQFAISLKVCENT